MRPIPLACLLAGLALAGAAGCGRGPPPVERLVLAGVRQPATSLPFVAFAAGCAGAERLEVEERTFELGRDALQLLRDGGADVAIAFEFPLVRAALADDRLRVLTLLHTSTRNTRVVARADRGIARFEELAGKRVSMARGTNAEFYADRALRLAGVNPGDVALVDLRPDLAVLALARGEVDAAVLSDPVAATAEATLGAGGRTLSSDLYVEASLLVTREDVLAARAPALERLVAALACGEAVVRDAPERALEAIRGRFPEHDDAALRAQLARVERGLGLDHVLLHLLADEAAWLRASGLVERAPAGLDRLVDRRVLERVEPDAVTLLRRPGSPP